MNKPIVLNKNKKIKSILNGRIIIITSNNNSSMPLFCPCCKFPMKTLEDNISYKKNKICNHCDNRWTNKKNILWPKGPDKKSDEWKEYINFRNIISKPNINFK